MTDTMTDTTDPPAYAWLSAVRELLADLPEVHVEAGAEDDQGYGSVYVRAAHAEETYRRLDAAGYSPCCEDERDGRWTCDVWPREETP